MFCTGQKNLKLLARNEGKIKSYESCFDVRAWSHDSGARDHYVRDWMKSDMPICVIPLRTVSGCLKTMTWRYRGRSAPRCHPNCKSKVVLESICNSCHAMKECLKTDENFEKYFEEEEFETSHWPCEKYLEALKSIKMFWKIIMERILRIRIPKDDDFEDACCVNESVQSVAKVWQEQLVHQALIVKNLTPLINNQLNKKQSNCWKSYTKYLKKIITFDNLRFIIDDDDDDETTSESKQVNENICACQDKATETDTVKLSIAASKKRKEKLLIKKISKCTSFKVKTTDFGCDARNINDEEINMYKTNLDYIQQQYNVQNDELMHLKTENMSLKLQLQGMAKISSPSHETMFYSENSASVILKPYESYYEKEKNIKDIDSEMIITMRDFENENFKHVSMLQVLHKSNGLKAPNQNMDTTSNCCKQKEDPIKILTKVHKTFGAIVQRELAIANQQKSESQVIEIDASYQKVHYTRSLPSSSIMSSQSMFSGEYVSTTHVQDQNVEIM